MALFIHNVGTSTPIPKINYNKYIWFYSDLSILQIKKRSSDNYLFIISNEKKSNDIIHLVSIKRYNYSGFKYGIKASIKKCKNDGESCVSKKL